MLATADGAAPQPSAAGGRAPWRCCRTARWPRHRPQREPEPPARPPRSSGDSPTAQPPPTPRRPRRRSSVSRRQAAGRTRRLPAAIGSSQSGDLSAARADYEQALRERPAQHRRAQRPGGHQPAARPTARGRGKPTTSARSKSDPQGRRRPRPDSSALRGSARPGAGGEPAQDCCSPAQPESARRASRSATSTPPRPRWREAQQAYFDAYAAEPGQPGLPVQSGGQPRPVAASRRLAAAVLPEALAAAAAHAAAFDRAQATARVPRTART
ncbi:MAG: hypothetical protein MZW92_18225 [Comamonadaceae bacterium]|nr:hypothetical protein [Comamonadaceae bacterium]